jgi:hypothetical protein
MYVHTDKFYSWRGLICAQKQPPPPLRVPQILHRVVALPSVLQLRLLLLAVAVHLKEQHWGLAAWRVVY